jgi:D-3-phosphoglycerate dehydrogenase
VDGINWAQSLAGQSGVAKKIEAGKSDYVGPEILGKKIGIIGLGAIGVLVANACVYLGMDVYGEDPYVSVDAAWSLSRSVKRATKEFIYENCDYISINCPFLKETEKMINAEVLGKVKKGVRIINAARAELVDNAAMVAALEDGSVACYVTDFPTDEVLGIKNVITIPHLGASTPESEDNCAVMAAIELREYLEKGNIRNSVNFPNCELEYNGKPRICVLHKNVPKLMGSMTNVIADNSLNIENMINKSKGDFAYTIIDVDKQILSEVVEQFKKIDGVIKVRSI